jgi:sirohydrochlorin ferrochelatase
MTQALKLLIDNGSTKPDATRSLRRIAASLSEACGETVYPVSLQHADRIAADQLGGQPALVLASFLRDKLLQGHRDFVALPLFFGRSRALTSFIPEQVERLAAEFGVFRLRQAQVLSPAPQGEPRLARMLAEHVAECAADLGRQPDRVVVVDHGSPLPEVTAVRENITEALRASQPQSVRVDQAVMERRSGREYDFNGRLLEELLDEAGAETVVLAMMFISPGRHAGPRGDIAQIGADAMRKKPGLRVVASSLIGEHPLLIDILRDRLLAMQ